MLKRRYLNPYCSEMCANNLLDGKLRCSCGDSGIYQWTWHPEPNSPLVITNNEVMFHPVYSSGTASLRGPEPFAQNRHHFWEIKFLTNLYGTDIMVGLATAKVDQSQWRHRFFSPLGDDQESWGYSYNGRTHHDNKWNEYGAKLGIGNLIGMHLDMTNGTLEYYLNREPLGVAFRGLKNKQLFPMVVSTAAQSAIVLTCALSFEPCLQFTTLQAIVKNPQLYKELNTIPGLCRIYKNVFFWMLPKEGEDVKRKRSEKQYLQIVKRKRNLVLL